MWLKEYTRRCCLKKTVAAKPENVKGAYQMKIAIIGAGWSGLSIMKVLLSCGHDVKVFEVNDDVGGTWNPQIAYHGLKIHNSLFSCMFEGEAPSENRNRLKRLYSQDIYALSQAYANDNKLYERICFRKKVKSVSYSTSQDKSTLEILDLDTGKMATEDFDFVVSTQFNSPRIPEFQQKNTFTGDIYHTNDVKQAVVDDIIRQNKKVVVLGGSKSGSDIALMFLDRNYQVKWLYRKAYWFNDASKANLFYRLLSYIAPSFMFNELSSKIIFTLMGMVGLIKTPGKKHLDFKKYHAGSIYGHDIKILKDEAEHIEGEIDHLDGRDIVLKSGTRIPCDVLICATGCDPISEKIDLKVDGISLNYEEVRYMYRSSIIPELPKLCFTGYFPFGMGPLNGFHRAAWLLWYFSQGLSTEKLKELAIEEGAYDDGFFKSMPLFDSSKYLFLNMRRKFSYFVKDGFISQKEIILFFYNLRVRLRYKPFDSAVKIINENKVAR